MNSYSVCTRKPTIFFQWLEMVSSNHFFMVMIWFIFQLIAKHKKTACLEFQVLLTKKHIYNPWIWHKIGWVMNSYSVCTRKPTIFFQWLEMVSSNHFFMVMIWFIFQLIAKHKKTACLEFQVLLTKKHIYNPWIWHKIGWVMNSYSVCTRKPTIFFQWLEMVSSNHFFMVMIWFIFQLIAKHKKTACLEFQVLLTKKHIYNPWIWHKIGWVMNSYSVCTRKPTIFFQWLEMVSSNHFFMVMIWFIFQLIAKHKKTACLEFQVLLTKKHIYNPWIWHKIGWVMNSYSVCTRKPTIFFQWLEMVSSNHFFMVMIWFIFQLIAKHKKTACLEFQVLLTKKHIYNPWIWHKIGWVMNSYSVCTRKPTIFFQWLEMVSSNHFFMVMIWFIFQLIAKHKKTACLEFQVLLTKKHIYNPWIWHKIGWVMNSYSVCTRKPTIFFQWLEMVSSNHFFMVMIWFIFQLIAKHKKTACLEFQVLLTKKHIYNPWIWHKIGWVMNSYSVCTRKPTIFFQWLEMVSSNHFFMVMIWFIFQLIAKHKKTACLEFQVLLTKKHIYNPWIWHKIGWVMNSYSVGMNVCF